MVEQQELSALLSPDGAAEVEGYLFSPFSRAPGLIGGPLAAGSKLAPFGPPISSQVNGTAYPTPGQPYPTGFTPVVPEQLFSPPDTPS